MSAAEANFDVVVASGDSVLAVAHMAVIGTCRPRSGHHYTASHDGPVSAGWAVLLDRHIWPPTTTALDRHDARDPPLG